MLILENSQSAVLKKSRFYKWESLVSAFTLARISVLLSLASPFTLDPTPARVSFFSPARVRVSRSG